MRLTTKSRYGLRMILDMALYGEKEPVPLSDIAHRQNISMKYLEKLIRQLRRGGLVTSHRGAAGGHRLARLPSKISVGDIVRILENCTAITDCAEKEEMVCGICNRAGDCLSQWVWIEASRALFERLDRITIAMLMENQTRLIKEVHAFGHAAQQSAWGK